MIDTKIISEAAALYKDVLKEHNVELLVELEDCEICYVPNMSYSHRSIWSEATLILFYRNKSNQDLGDDMLTCFDLSDGTRRRIYFRIIGEEDIDYNITKMACDNLQLSYSRSLRPSYVIIDSKDLDRCMKLLPFI